jgi:hypothetical protein
MLALIWILAVGAANTVNLVDEVYKIPAKPGWRYFELGLKQRPARVLAEFECRSGEQRVRLALMRRDDLERMRSTVPYGVIAETELSGGGKIDYPLQHPGDYVLVVDNQSQAPSDVLVRIRLDFSHERGPRVTRISPERQLSVIILSFAFFFSVVTFSARRLLRSVRPSSPPR